MWILLLHQIPPSPPYLRAKILRRLKQIGALSLKKSAYLLPDTEEAVEDFQWLLQEIRAEGGEGWVMRAEAVAGLTDDSIREAFRDMRAADYRELLQEAPALGFPKLKKRYDEIGRIDFFAAPGSEEIRKVMGEMEAGQQNASEYHARRWVTRRGIKIDRTASAWLIRRFVDPAAEFSFVDPNQHQPREGDLRFDMFEGEFTHVGDACTFEVLLERCGPKDAALAAIAEIVHDLDLKDGKFDRPETAGIGAMIDGLALRHADDARRLEEGLVIFDALYARLKGTA